MHLYSWAAGAVMRCCEIFVGHWEDSELSRGNGKQEHCSRKNKETEIAHRATQRTNMQAVEVVLCLFSTMWGSKTHIENRGLDDLSTLLIFRRS